MKRFLPHIALLLIVTEVFIVLLSWLLSAAFPSSHIRSLLSAEGVRWFFGHFINNLSTPVLIWLLLLAMAFGCVKASGYLHYTHSYRERRALLSAVIVLLVYVGVLLLLTMVPHAILLSATGKLFPSPFSVSIVPVVSLGLLVVSIVYGIVVGTFRSLLAIYEAVVGGISAISSCLFFYILFIQIYYSLCFVFG